MQGVLVGGSGDNRIDFAAEGQPGRGLDGVAGDAAGADDPVSVAGGVAAAQPPAADRNAALRRHDVDLVLGPNDGDLRIDGLRQSKSRDLRPDAAWVSERYREPRT